MAILTLEMETQSLNSFIVGWRINSNNMSPLFNLLTLVDETIKISNVRSIFVKNMKRFCTAQTLNTLQCLH